MSNDDYEARGVAAIRELCPGWHMISDAAVAGMYSYWSEEESGMCAGWLSMDDYGVPPNFIEWAVQK